MNRYEKDEISRLDPKYRPLGAWKYFFLQILFSIPIIGWIFLIIFACSGRNINRRSFARSYFCALLIIVIAVIALYFLAGGAAFFQSILDTIKNGAGQ